MLTVGNSNNRSNNRQEKITLLRDTTGNVLV